MDFYGERSLEGNSSLTKPHMNSTGPSPRSRELHRARRDVDQIKESRRVADSVRARVETELSDAKKTVRELASKIEEANSRAKGLHKPRKPKWREEGSDLALKKDKDRQYAEVMKELEQIKEELDRLKLDMASLLDEKKLAEKSTEASSSKMWSHSRSVKAMKKEIQELNEEQVVVELARIEARKEYEAIEEARKEEANHYTTQVEETRKKISEIIEENNRAKELEMTLAVTLSDVDLLEDELALVKEMDKRIARTESLRHMVASPKKEEEGYSPSLLKSVTQELEAAKIELASIKEEGFHFMTSMDVIRDELQHVREEKERLEKTEKKQELTVQHLHSKILRAKAKLEAVSAAEEKANSIASNLSLTLEQLRTEAETVKKEKEIISEETENIKREIPNTESEIELAEERLEAALQELKAVKSSEAMALDNLKTLIEDTIKARESASQHSSIITITTFEHDYLTGRAGGAEEIADKKVAAAQAWVEALKASEKEILMKIEMAQREISEQSLEEEVYTTGTAVCARRSVEGVLGKWVQNGEKNLQSEKLQLKVESPRKTVYRSGNMTPLRRLRSRKLGSPRAQHMSRSAARTGQRREKEMPNLTKLFSNKNIDTGS